MNKTALIFFTMLCLGCNNEPCLDIPELDKMSTQTQEWYVNDSIGNKIITDDNGISQTLELIDKYSGGVDNAVEDDCGNIYGSFNFSIQYRASVSPLNLVVDIHGGGLPENGFYLKLSVTNPFEHKSTTYDFVAKTSRENNAAIEFLEQIKISNKDYIDVLKITFNNTNTENDTKTVYYAKGFGIIKLINANGIEFEVN